MEILSVAITLFLIMDPFGNTPVFLSVLDKIPHERRRRVLVRELLIALGVIMLFVYVGSYVMSFLGLQQESVSIAGGIILFLIGLRMVFPHREVEIDTETSGEPLVVPLAIPLISGPSTLAALLMFSSSGSLSRPHLLFAALMAWLATFVVLFSATSLASLLTKRGLTAIERLMGMVLVALSVQMFLDGLASYLK